MNLLDTPLENTNIFLRSSEFTTSMNTGKSDLLFELNNPLRIHSNMDFLVSLESFSFTNSFYIINDYNKYFYYSFASNGSGWNKIVIDKGNYDINSFLTYMNALLIGAGFAFTYSSVTMKITITNGTAFRLVNPYANVLNIFELLGFDDNGTSTLATTITAPYMVNFVSTQILHIVIPNLEFNSVGLKNRNRMNIINSVPIESLAGEVQTWKNSSNFKYKVTESVITFLNIRI